MGWKVVWQAGKPDELFRLATDPGETTDLGAKAAKKKAKAPNE